jgi:hypothetical protein
MIGKIITRVLKVMGIILGVILFLVAAYAVFNTPFVSEYKRLTQTDLEQFSSYLGTHASDPREFVSEQFKTHDVILIGEMHRRLQDVEFVKSLIPYVHETNHVTVVGWEFGASDFQGEVDSIVNAPRFDEKKAISVMRRSSWFWNFEEYLDIFRTVWEINSTIPAQAEKIRFLQLGSDYNERLLRAPDRTVRETEARRFMYDKKMAEIIEQEVLLKGKKALWYSGVHHAFTHYRQPLIFFLRKTGDERRGGNFLNDTYGDRVYMIALHAPAMNRWLLLSDIIPSLQTVLLSSYYPFGGVLDKVYDIRKQPFAFDAATSPFGLLQDNYSYYSFDHWGAIRLKDYCDGYIVLCSFKEARPVHPIKEWVNTKEDFAEVKNRMRPELSARFDSCTTLQLFLEGDIAKTVRFLHTVDTTGY